MLFFKVEQLEARPTGALMTSNVDPTQSADLVTRVRHLQDAIASKDQVISALQVTLADLERCSYDGVLMWKLKDVTRRRREAVSGQVNSIYSYPFYSSRHGYKMCARLYFNGDGMGRGTHLSLYFVIMQGEFDDLLRWPFKQKVGSIKSIKLSTRIKCYFFSSFLVSGYNAVDRLQQT